MNLETIILSKLTQEQKIKHHVITHRRVLNNNTWTQGGEHHTLGSVGVGIAEGQQGVGNWGGITWGAMPDIGDGRKAANHIAMYVPMQQSCMFFTCTPEPKVQFKKKRIKMKSKPL